MTLSNNTKHTVLALGLVLIGVWYFSRGISDTDQVQNVERQIHEQGLNADRTQTEVFVVLNPSGSGLCIRKAENTALVVVDEHGRMKKAETKTCGTITTEPILKIGTTVSVGYEVYSINHIFIEQATEKTAGALMKPGQYLCIAVDKLSHLPEYETKGPWFVIPCKPAI